MFVCLFFTVCYSTEFVSIAQYPSIFLLMVLIAVYGYFQPFQVTAVNVLEVALSVDTVILLLLRRTETIEDVLGISSVVQTQSRNDSDTDCVDEVEGITDFTWLLFPFYYLPLLISCAAVVVWITLQLKSVIASTACCTLHEFPTWPNCRICDPHISSRE